MNVRLKTRILLLCAFSVLAALSATAQSNNYRQVNLVSSAAGLGLNVDPALARPWGMAFSTGQPIRLANNKTGNFRSYDATGRSLRFAGAIALPRGITTGHSNPSGIAANSTNLFAPQGSLASPFLFATEDGTISGEYADTQGNILANTILAVDNSKVARRNLHRACRAYPRLLRSISGCCRFSWRLCRYLHRNFRPTERARSFHRSESTRRVCTLQLERCWKPGLRYLRFAE